MTSKNRTVSVTPIQTPVFQFGQDLAPFIASAVPRGQVRERMVIAVTSKIVSLAEKRCVSREEIDRGIGKIGLVRREADHFLAEVGYGCQLTIKHGLFIPSAGIDESNSQDGSYILFPEDPYLSAKNIWLALKEAWGLKEFGVVLTDSHTTPLRKGVNGISLSHWGFKGVRSLIGKHDLFNRELKMTQINIADGLAGMAVLVMGEGAESTPLAVIEGGDLEFTNDFATDPETVAKEVRMELEDDLYFPFFKDVGEGIRLKP